MEPVPDDFDGHGEQGGELIRAETVRALGREHEQLIVSLRALATLLREPETATSDEEESILARILDAELNQVSVLDGEIITALRLEKGGAGPVRKLDLARALDVAIRRSGRMTIIGPAEPVPIAGHGAVIEQEISSALALAHRIADGAVRARAEPHPDGGGSVVITFAVTGDELARARRGQRVILLGRMVKAVGGRFSMDAAGNLVRMELRFPDIAGAGADGSLPTARDLGSDSSDHRDEVIDRFPI